MGISEISRFIIIRSVIPILYPKDSKVVQCVVVYNKYGNNTRVKIRANNRSKEEEDVNKQFQDTKGHNYNPSEDSNLTYF